MSKDAKVITSILAVFAVLLVVGAYSVDSPDKSASEKEPTATSRYGAEVSDGRNFGEVFATEHTGSLDPRAQLVSRFNRLLDGIADRCSKSREWVADRVLSGHQMLTERGGDASLLDVAEGWFEAVEGPGSSDCVSTLSALLVTLEGGG